MHHNLVRDHPTHTSMMKMRVHSIWWTPPVIRNLRTSVVVLVAKGAVELEELELLVV